MTDRWFSFLCWMALIAMPIAISILIDARTRRISRSRMKQHLSNEWLYQHRGRHVA